MGDGTLTNRTTPNLEGKALLLLTTERSVTSRYYGSKIFATAKKQ